MYSYYFSHLSQPRLLFVCKMKNKWEREGQKTIFHNKWVFIQLFLLDMLDILHILDILYRCRIKNHFNKKQINIATIFESMADLLFPVPIKLLCCQNI